MSNLSWLSSRSPALPEPTSSAARRIPATPTVLGRAAQPADVLDRLALGQLEDDVARVEAVPGQHPQQGVDAELVGLHRPR